MHNLYVDLKCFCCTERFLFLQNIPQTRQAENVLCIYPVHICKYLLYSLCKCETFERLKTQSMSESII